MRSSLKTQAKRAYCLNCGIRHVDKGRKFCCWRCFVQHKRLERWARAIQREKRA